MTHDPTCRCIWCASDPDRERHDLTIMSVPIRDVDAALRRECGRRLGTLRCEAPAGHGGWHYDGEAGVFWPGREEVQR